MNQKQINSCRSKAQKEIRRLTKLLREETRKLSALQLECKHPNLVRLAGSGDIGEHEVCDDCGMGYSLE